MPGLNTDVASVTFAYFQVLSYAGTVIISVLTDPDHFTELDALAGALRAELDLISPGCAAGH